MVEVRAAVAQAGLSPKVLNTAIVGLLTAALLKFGVSLDPILEQFLNVIVMVLVGYVSPPGDVLTAPVGDPSDDLLEPSVANRLRHDDGTTLVEAALVAFIVVCILVVLLRFT